MVNKLGPGSLVAKIDLKMPFASVQYTHKASTGNEHRQVSLIWPPFSPFLMYLATAPECTAVHNYGIIHLFHYLVTPLLWEHQKARLAVRILDLCNLKYASVNSEKVVGPSTTLTFLGIQLNSIDIQASFISDRKEEFFKKLRSVVTCTNTNYYRLSLSCHLQSKLYLQVGSSFTA